MGFGVGPRSEAFGLWFERFLPIGIDGLKTWLQGAESKIRVVFYVSLQHLIGLGCGHWLGGFLEWLGGCQMWLVRLACICPSVLRVCVVS